MAAIAANLSQHKNRHNSVNFTNILTDLGVVAHFQLTISFHSIKSYRFDLDSRNSVLSQEWDCFQGIDAIRSDPCNHGGNLQIYRYMFYISKVWSSISLLNSQCVISEAWLLLKADTSFLTTYLSPVNNTFCPTMFLVMICLVIFNNNKGLDRLLFSNDLLPDLNIMFCMSNKQSFMFLSSSHVTATHGFSTPNTHY